MDTSPYPVPCDPAVAVFVAGLDEDAREFFEERAAIAEFEGRLDRAAAEALARELTLAFLARRRQRRPPGLPPG